MSEDDALLLCLGFIFCSGDGVEALSSAVDLYGGGGADGGMVRDRRGGMDEYWGGSRRPWGSGEGVEETWQKGQYEAKRGFCYDFGFRRKKRMRSDRWGRFTCMHLPQMTRQQHSTLRSCGRREDGDDDGGVWEYGGVEARLPVQVLQYSMV